MHWTETKDWCGRGLDLNLLYWLSNCTFLSWIVSRYQDFQRVSLSQKPCETPKLPCRICRKYCVIDNACPDQPPVDYSAPVSMNLDETWPEMLIQMEVVLGKLGILGHFAILLRTCRILLNGLHQDLQGVELQLGMEILCGLHGSTMAQQVTQVKDETFNGDYWHRWHGKHHVLDERHGVWSAGPGQHW